MRLVRLGVLGLLAGHHKLLDSILVNQVWSRATRSRFVVFNGLLNRDFNLIFFAGVNVAVDVDERCLPWAPGEEAEVRKLVRCMRLVLLLVNGWRKQAFDSRLFNVNIVIIFDFLFMAAKHSSLLGLLELIGALHWVLVLFRGRDLAGWPGRCVFEHEQVALGLHLGYGLLLERHFFRLGHALLLLLPHALRFDWI